MFLKTQTISMPPWWLAKVRPISPSPFLLEAGVTSVLRTAAIFAFTCPRQHVLRERTGSHQGSWMVFKSPSWLSSSNRCR